MYGEFAYDSDGNLVLLSSYDDLRTNYGLSDKDVDTLKLVIDNAKTLSSTATVYGTTMSSSAVVPLGGTAQTVAPNAFVQNSTIYFTNDEVLIFLLSAAYAGPAALQAALIAFASLSLGPVGTFLGVALAVMGVPSFGQLCYHIIQAAVNDQGVYLGIRWNGIFPNIVSGTW